MLAQIISKSTYLRTGAFHLMVFVVTWHALRTFPYCQSLFVFSGEGGNPLQMGCAFRCYCINTPVMIIFLYCINAILGSSTPALAPGIWLTYQVPAWMACSMHRTSSQRVRIRGRGAGLSSLSRQISKIQTYHGLRGSVAMGFLVEALAQSRPR